MLTCRARCIVLGLSLGILAMATMSSRTVYHFPFFQGLVPHTSTKEINSTPIYAMWARSHSFLASAQNHDGKTYCVHREEEECRKKCRIMEHKSNFRGPLSGRTSRQWPDVNKLLHTALLCVHLCVVQSNFILHLRPP